MAVRLLLVWMLAVLSARSDIGAGAALIDVSPERFPVIVNCMMTERSVDQLVSPLYSRTLVLEEGSRRLSITVVDSCMMPRELLDRAKEMAAIQTGILPSRMLISATHTHFAPAAMGCLGSDVDRAYAAWLPGKIAESIAHAAKNLQPARVGSAVENDYEHTHNRRWIYKPQKMLRDPFGNLTVRANMHPGYQNPDAITESGPVDPGLTVLSVQTLQGAPIALLANYSQHYFGDNAVSPDYFGLFSSKIAARLKADQKFIAIMSQGTSGDQMWMDYSKPKSDLTIDRYADGVVDSAMRAIDRIQYQTDIPLGMIEDATLTFRRRTPDAQRLEWARRIVTEMGERKPKTQIEIYAREQILINAEPARQLKLQALRIGDLAITAIPNEVFAISGLKLKARSPFTTTMNIELANGADGYIPPPEQHRLGGYTTWPARSAGLHEQAESTIVETLLGMLERLAGKPRREPLDPVGPYTEAILKSNPWAYWSFNEFQGPVLIDRIQRRGASYDGNVAFQLPGFADRALYLAGGRFVASVPELPTSNTVEYWFWIGDGLAPVRTQTTTALKQWHHIAIVQNGTTSRVYLNGKLDQERPASQSTRTVTIGPFEGKVDELAVYNRALEDSEIAAHSSITTGSVP
jgi:hypothetical protein